MERVLCCGLNESTQLTDKPIIPLQNNPNLPLQQVPNHWFKNFYNEKIKTISVGWNHTVILTTQNNLLGIGNNCFGQLGDFDFNLTLNIPTNILTNGKLFEKLSDKTIKLMTCGVNHTVFVTENELFVCGYNMYGQLGIGNTMDSGWERVDYLQNLQQYNLQNNLQQNLKKEFKIKKIIYYSTFLILENNLTLACGDNTSFEIGLKEKKYALKFEEMNTKNFKENEFVIDVASGCLHTLFLTNLGNVYGCGKNDSLQLDNCFHTTTTATTTANSDDGDNENGESQFDEDQNLKEPTLLKNFKDVKSIHCGWYYSVMLNNKGEVYGCGENSDGQLTFDCNTHSKMPLTKLNTPQNIKNIFTGSTYIIYLTNDYKVYSNGSNEHLALGLPYRQLDQNDNNNNENVITLNNEGEEIVIVPTLVKSLPFENFDIFLGNSAASTFFVERRSKELERMKFKLKESLTNDNKNDILIKCLE